MKAFVVIDLQNDITKNYREIIEKVNEGIDRAEKQGMEVVYIKHNNITAGTRTFKPGTKGEELVPELKIVSENIFTKTKGNALTNQDFAKFLKDHDVDEIFLTGADATACVKSTAYNMVKEGYKVHVLYDCVTSYNKMKIDEMLKYYESKGCLVHPLSE